MNFLLAKKYPRTRLKVQFCMERHLLFFLHGQLRASKATLEACTLSTASFLPRSFHTWSTVDAITAEPEVTASPSENWTALHKTFPRSTRSLMFNTRWKTAEGLPNKNGSCARISSTSGDIVAARWRRAWWRRALRARAISKWACQEQFYNNQRLSFGAKPSPPPSHLAPKCQELSHAQISDWWRHRWGRPRTVRCIAASSPPPPFFFVAVGAIFFSPPPFFI